MILFEKFGQHQPLNQQSGRRYAREGVELSLSTLADQVGACATALRPLHAFDRSACPGRRTAPHGDPKHHRADPGESQTKNGSGLGLCSR